MTDLNAAERLDTKAADLLQQFGHDVVASMSLAGQYSLKDVAHAAVHVTDEFYRERDKSLIDEAFARSVGEDVEHGWFLVGHHGGGRAYLIRYQTGWQLRITGRVDIPNPTIGDFYTACRLFLVQLKEGV